MTDPISAMLIMIKNASLASRETVTVPFSNIKKAIADCLLKQGYLKSVAQKTDAKSKPVLVLEIAYEAGRPKVTDLQRISKPSRRVYLGMRDVRPVKNGLGIMVLSTPKGIMTGREAKAEMVGGEVLFKLW